METILDERCVRLERDEAVAVCTLNEPEARNPFTYRMLGGLADALAWVEDPRSAVRCLVLTGAGRGFSAGTDLRGIKAWQQGEETWHDEGPVRRPPPIDTVLNPLIRRLRSLPCGLVAAVNGAAAGGGLALALMADLVIAARSAVFVQAFGKIGLVPDMGISWVVPRRIGLTRALELALVTDRLSAEQALEWGLVNHVVDDEGLMDAAREAAGKLAALNPRTVALTRRLYWQGLENSLETQLDLEHRYQLLRGRLEELGEPVPASL